VLTGKRQRGKRDEGSSPQPTIPGSATDYVGLLAIITVKNWRKLLEQSFTAHMPWVLACITA